VDYIQQRSLVRTFTEVADDVGVNEKTVRNVFRDARLKNKSRKSQNTP
jgi:predicted transcriptional regulator